MYRFGISVLFTICGVFGCVVAHAQSDGQFKSYLCRNQSADNLANVLRPLLPKADGVQLIVDRQNNRLLLSGPDSVQRLASNVLRQSDLFAPRRIASPNKPASVAPIPTVANQAQLKSVFIPVAPERWETVRQQLSAIFRQQIQPLDSQYPNSLFFIFGDDAQRRLRVSFDAARNGITATGPVALAGQFSTLMRKLSEQTPQGYRTQVFRLQRDSHSPLKNAVRSMGNEKAVPVGRTDNNQSRVVVPAGTLGPVRTVAFQDTTNPQPEPLRQFEGVEIESLPDLDVIILRGRDPDLAKLADVIKRLEEISQETQPEIRIITLNHASSAAVAEIIETASADLIGGRQGRVKVTPLIKPNALLLIGWGDAVNAIIELATKLDTPVEPTTQSMVFRLKYANAEAANTTIESFFANRQGLGPRVTSTADPRTNSIIVYASPRDMVEVKRMISDLDQPGGNSVQHTKVFAIENSLAADIAETLQEAIGEPSGSLAIEIMGVDGKQIIRSGSLEQTKVTANARNNSLIITTAIENMRLIEALIKQLDTPVGEVQLKIFQCRNGNAASMIETLRSLIPSQSGATSALQLASASGESSLAPLRFSVDLRSNSIIATGSDGDLRIVEALLLRLDQATDQTRKSTVIQLKNAPAVDVATAINQYLLNQRQIDQAAPGDNNPFQDIEREVVVVPEPVANKLILAATPRYYEEIKSLIDKLDEQPPQVMIQVLIAEVALDNINEFGVEMGVQSSVLFDRSLLGDLLTTTNSTQTSTAAGVTTVTEEIVQAASNIPGFLFNSADPLGNSGSSQALSSAGSLGGQAISNFAVGRRNQQAGFGGLVLSASSQNVSVLLRALNQSRHVRVLSRPQIRTLDNQPAYIQVGQRVPRIVGSTVNQNGQSNSITLENVGLILGVTPRVSPDNTVVMEIDAEKSSLGDEQDGIPVAVSTDGTVIRSPRVDTTTAQATIGAANGETVILGGLISETRSGTHRRVPYICRVPILRNLFRFDSDSSQRSELLIILTPHVIRSAADGERLKQAEIARMNWCEGDVYRVHGDINLSQVSLTQHMESSEPPVVYPDDNPTGEMQSVDVESLNSPMSESLQTIREATPIQSLEGAR